MAALAAASPKTLKLVCLSTQSSSQTCPYLSHGSSTLCPAVARKMSIAGASGYYGHASPLSLGNILQSACHLMMQFQKSLDMAQLNSVRPEELALFYVDSDGDRILITSAPDYEIFLSTSHKETVTLYACLLSQYRGVVNL